MIILIIISFILDGIFSSFSNIFFPLFALSSLIIVYIYNKKNILHSVIMGLLFGIIFTPYFYIECICYYICFKFISYFFKRVPYNLINVLILTFLNIILYRTINFIILVISNVIVFDFNILFKSIYSSIIINLIYISIVYFIFNKIRNKKSFSLYN